MVLESNRDLYSTINSVLRQSYVRNCAAVECKTIIILIQTNLNIYIYIYIIITAETFCLSVPGHVKLLYIPIPEPDSSGPTV